MTLDHLKLLTGIVSRLKAYTTLVIITKEKSLSAAKFRGRESQLKAS